VDARQAAESFPSISPPSREITNGVAVALLDVQLDHRGRPRELRMIERVKGFKAEFQRLGLRQFGGFQQSHVPVLHGPVRGKNGALSFRSCRARAG